MRRTHKQLLESPLRDLHASAGWPGIVYTERREGRTPAGRDNWVGGIDDPDGGVECQIRIEWPGQSRTRFGGGAGFEVEGDVLIVTDPDEVAVATGEESDRRASVIEDGRNGRRYRVLRSPNETNETDSAIIELDTSNTASSFGAGFGDLGSPERPTFSGRYVNDGRTTGLTSARLVAVDVSVNVNSGGTTLPYSGVDAYENYSRGGDSGSLTARYNASANRAHPVGLHFAAGSDRSFCIPFNTVQQYHDIDIPTRSVSKPPGDGTPAYFEITPLIHETRSDGSLDFLVANTGGSSANRTVDIADETGHSLDSKQVFLSAHENTVVSLTPAGLPTGSQTLIARSAESDEQFTAEITTSSVTTTSNPEPGTVRWDTGGEWADIMPSDTQRTVYHDIGAHRTDRVSIGVDPDWLEARDCVLYAPFDETSGTLTTAIDYTNNRNTISGALNDGVLTGLSPGVEGTTHFGFPGGQNVNFGNKGYNRSAFSFFAWIWLNSTIEEQDAVIGKYRQDTNSREWFCDIVTGEPWRIRYRMWRDPADASSAFGVNMHPSMSFGVNEWVHVGFAAEAGGLIRFFKNGESAGSLSLASTDHPAQTNAPLVVGLRDLDYSRYFKGRIDRPILFNQAATVADANYIYQSSKDGQHRTAFKGVA
jgi:hypothetical protein